MVLRHGCAIVLDPPVLQHQDTVGEVEHAVVVRHDDAGAVFGHGHFAQQVHDPAARIGVQRGGRLVAHHQPRFVDKRAGDGHALLLAARKLVWQLGCLVADIQFFQHGDGPLPRLAAVHSLRDERDGRIAGRIDAGDEIVLLEDKADIRQPELDQLRVGEVVDVRAEDLDLAFCRPQDAAHDADQRRFAGPAFAHHVSQFAGADFRVDAVQNGDRLLARCEIARDAARGDGGAAHRNTAAGSVFSTLRSASQPVSAKMIVTASRLNSGTCQGM